MAEEELIPVFGLYILIEKEPGSDRLVGSVHDFLVNRQRPGQQETLMRIILALEFIGFQSKCAEVRVFSQITEDSIMEDLEFTRVSAANGQVYWTKDAKKY